MKKHNSNTSLTTRSKARRYMAVWTALVLSLCLFTVPASAAGGDPLDIVNNLSDFIFSIIKALGVIILGWGRVCPSSPTTPASAPRASCVCSAGL